MYKQQPSNCYTVVASVACEVAHHHIRSFCLFYSCPSHQYTPGVYLQIKEHRQVVWPIHPVAMLLIFTFIIVQYTCTYMYVYSLYVCMWTMYCMYYLYMTG